MRDLKMRRTKEIIQGVRTDGMALARRERLGALREAVDRVELSDAD
jgi:hypothetical protein